MKGLALGLLLRAAIGSAGFGGTDVFIPASARAAGAGTSQFYSTLWVTNPGSAPASATLRFFQRDTSNTSPVSVPVTIAPGETKKWENVVQTLFGLPSASGAIRIQADQELLASSRTYDLPPGADLRDAKGLFFSAIPRALAIGPGDTAQLQGVSQGGSEDYRYNFGLVETSGAPATVRIAVKGSDGSPIGTKEYTLLAFEAKQFGVADAAPAIATVNGRIEASVVAGTGSVLVYGTGVANGSQDSIGFEMSFRSALLAPSGVTSLNGLTGALTLAAGSGVAITPSGSTLTIAATSAPASLALPYAGSASTAAGTAAFAAANTGAGLGVSGAGGAGVGVYGTTTGAFGVKGQEGSPTLVSFTPPKGGVWGDSQSGYGIIGTSGSGIGVTGASSSKNGIQGYSFTGGVSAVYGISSASSNVKAGHFVGGVDVNGAMTKSSGSFKIDHPLEPETKYLYHSFVESPDMKNVYDGLVVLDARGEAVVALPDWFEALNRDFRYQLTCVGGWAPVYVAREVSGNSFAIAGGRPGMKVSWQLTGTRHDAWAEAHRIPVEELKDDVEKGTYLHPELFGAPEEKRAEWARDPETWRTLRALREQVEALRRADEAKR